jgi:hypothetical protein
MRMSERSPSLTSYLALLVLSSISFQAGELHTTLFEPFQILRHSNRESDRKESENVGSGRDLEVWLSR